AIDSNIYIKRLAEKKRSIEYIKSKIEKKNNKFLDKIYNNDYNHSYAQGYDEYLSSINRKLRA
ncbi:MAG: hypothetical protein WCX46_04630, partial [Candidatus Paceibacterota bacterium]